MPDGDQAKGFKGTNAMLTLQGKVGLVVGIANDQSIAWGCANTCRELGAELAITYLNEKAEPHVRPLAEKLDAPLILPCDVSKDGQLETVFDAIKDKWGRLDFVIHSIAFAPRSDLHGRVVDSSAEGFSQAMAVSVHSFIRMGHLAEPLMPNGGALLTMSYYGAEKVVAHYNIMGPVKAALESATRYMAYELGEKNIRVNALSPGPLQTRAASGISHFDELVDRAARDAPLHKLVTPEDVGRMAAFLVSDWGKSITGAVSYIDAGLNIRD